MYYNHVCCVYFTNELRHNNNDHNNIIIVIGVHGIDIDCHTEQAYIILVNSNGFHLDHMQYTDIIIIIMIILKYFY